MSRSTNAVPHGGRSMDRSGPASRSSASTTGKARREWATYWRDRNLRFHRFDPLPRSHQVEDLLAAVDADSTGIFWG
ncbi:MAG: DUF3024 domain-containing protein [Jiangellaceae bacterium]